MNCDTLSMRPSANRRLLGNYVGSLFQIGWAYAMGIALAIITCGPTSGGHFNPAITLCLAFWQGFPWKKVPYYIFAQILGAFLAGMILMGQYHPQMTALGAEMVYVAGRIVSRLVAIFFGFFFEPLLTSR
jgi:glycerol uptake facilitator-like aquaporin